MTGGALRTAAGLGFTSSGMIGVIQTMRRDRFRKSMTSYKDYTGWQDVYTIPSDVGELYIKFRADVVTEFVLLSVKGKGSD